MLSTGSSTSWQSGQNHDSRISMSPPGEQRAERLNWCQKSQDLARRLYTVVDDIAIHRSAEVEGGSNIKGPAIIGSDAFVGAGAFIRGRVYLGRACVVGHACELKTSLSANQIAPLSGPPDRVIRCLDRLT